MIALLVAAVTASQVYTAQLDVLQAISDRYPSVDVSVVWQPCGDENAKYLVLDRQIVLCTELAEAGEGAAVFAAAHEMGHAVLGQLAGDLTERDADEFAALTLISMDRQQDVLDGAMWFLGLPDQRTSDGVHPSPHDRAREVACLEDGSELDGNAECQMSYAIARAYYDALLEDE